MAGRVTGNMKREHAWYIVQFGTLPYEVALDFQHRLVEERQQGTLGEDMVLLLEHEPVFTLGRRGGLDNVRVAPRFLDRRRIRVVETERGGNVTYHGPGQIVAYPVIDLHSLGLGIPEYVKGLEEVMIRTAGEWGVSARRSEVNHGVWVGTRKLGSVGLAVRRGIAFHGLALNVDLSLEPFDWINPCGLSGYYMTSLKEEGALVPDRDQVRQEIVRHLEGVFGIRSVPLDTVAFKERFGPKKNQ